MNIQNKIKILIASILILNNCGVQNEAPEPVSVMVVKDINNNIIGDLFFIQNLEDETYYIVKNDYLYETVYYRLNKKTGDIELFDDSIDYHTNNFDYSDGGTVIYDTNECNMEEEFKTIRSATFYGYPKRCTHLVSQDMRLFQRYGPNALIWERCVGRCNKEVLNDFELGSFIYDLYRIKYYYINNDTLQCEPIFDDYCHREYISNKPSDYISNDIYKHFDIDTQSFTGPLTIDTVYR